MKRDWQTERANQKKQEQLERNRQQERERQREEERRKLARQQKHALESQEELRHRQSEQSRLHATEYREQRKRIGESQEHTRTQHRAKSLAQAKAETIIAQRESKKRDRLQQEHNQRVRTAESLRPIRHLQQPREKPRGTSSSTAKRERIGEHRKEVRVRQTEHLRRTGRQRQPREKPGETRISTAKRGRIEEHRKEARVHLTERSRRTERPRQPREKPRETSSSTAKRGRIEEHRKEARVRQTERPRPIERPRKPVSQREQRVRTTGEHERIEVHRKEARVRAIESQRIAERLRRSQENHRQISTAGLSERRAQVKSDQLHTEKRVRESQESRRLTDVSRRPKKQPRMPSERRRVEEPRKAARTDATGNRHTVKQIQRAQEKNRRAISVERRGQPLRVADERRRLAESRRTTERTRPSQNHQQAKRHEERRIRSAQAARQKQREVRNQLRQQPLNASGPVSFGLSPFSTPPSGVQVGGSPPLGTPVGDPPPLLTARIPSGNLSNDLVWLKTSRNRIVSAETGRTVLLRGVNRSGLEYSEPTLNPSNPFIDAAGISQTEIQEIVTVWGANIIRLPFNQDWALNGRGGQSAEVYLEALDQVIYWASSYGAYTLLDLQWIDSNQRNAPLPNRDSITVWKSLAKRYQFEPAVLYDVFSEPHDPQPGDGPLEGVDDDGTFFPLGPGTLVTMNEWQPWARQLIRAIRRIHTDALVFVSGIDWAYDLRGMPLTIVPGGSKVFANLVYCTHIYPLKGPPSPLQGGEPLPGSPRSPSWYQAFGYLTRSVPVFASEWGVEETHEEDPDMLWPDTLGQYLSSLRMGWTAWSWSDTPRLVRQLPRLNATVFGLPHDSTRYGDVVRDHLVRP